MMQVGEASIGHMIPLWTSHCGTVLPYRSMSNVVDVNGTPVVSCGNRYPVNDGFYLLKKKTAKYFDSWNHVWFRTRPLPFLLRPSLYCEIKSGSVGSEEAAKASRLSIAQFISR